jgi:RHS repeat-associated protein
MRAINHLLALIVLVLFSVLRVEPAHAANGECKWEGGSGASGGHAYCAAEDCKGNGGQAQCSSGVGATTPVTGPNGWTFDTCDEGAASMFSIATWCVAAGGTWDTSTSDPKCIGPPGGGTTFYDAQAADDTALTYSRYRLGASCTVSKASDTGWGATINSNFCWPGSTIKQLGVVTRSLRQAVYQASGGPSCGGSMTITFLKFREAKCPPGYKQRTAVAGPECFLPDECCQRVGNPISPVSGTKYQDEVDYVAPPGVGLELHRYYRSTAFMHPMQLTSSLPAGDDIAEKEYWRFSYDQQLYFVTSNTNIVAIYEGADGTYRSFDPAGHETGNVAGAGATIQAGAGYVDVTLPDHSVERFDGATGNLVSITTRSGLVTTIGWNGCNRVVTGPFGHTLTFVFDCMHGVLLSVTLPDGGSIQYAPDDSGRPATVTYPDLTTKNYEYGDFRNQWLLTSIRDENHQVFAQYGYDDQGRANSTQHAGGANAYFVNFTTSTVQDSLGNQTHYTFSTEGGAYRKAGHSQPCLDCGELKLATYDTYGNPTSRTDFNGNQTLYLFDSSRNLETWRTEAAGTPQARAVTTQWHPTFRLPVQVDEPGKRTTFDYDSNGNLLTRTETDLATSTSRTATFTYNSVGQVMTIDGPRTDVNDVVTFTYNSCTSGGGCGQVATVTDAVGNVRTYLTYDANGNSLTISDPNGVVTTLTYDTRQRLTSSTVGTETIAYEYWPTGLLKKATAPDGSFLSYTYDDAHRLTGIADGVGNHISYTLDATGNATAANVYDPTNTLFRTRSWIYDSVGRLQQSTGSASQITSFGYDDASNLVAVTDPLGRTTTFDYDASNLPINVTNAIGGTTQYTYDGRRNMLTVKDPRQLQTSYTYNGFDDVTAVSSPDSGVSTYVRNPDGAVHAQSDARGSEADYTYDAAGRITSIAYSDESVGFTYDAGTYGRGHLTGMTDGSGSTQFTYDPLGRLASRTQTTGSVVRTVAHTYTATGLLNTTTTPSGQVISYTYDNGRVSGISVNGTTLIHNVLYAPFGLTLGWQWGNGTYTVREYDTDGQLITIDSAGLTTYAYNTDGSLQSRSDDAPPPSSASSSPLLINVSTTSNRVESTTATASSTTWTYAYDAAGNTTNDGLHTFNFNGAGRLASASVSGAPTVYAYNGFGERVKKTGPGGQFHFVYDEAGHLLGQYDASGALVEEIVWLGDIPIATMRTSTSGGVGFFYIHADNLNSPVRLTRTSDNVVMWRWDHDPYGAGAPDEDAENNGAFVFFNSRFPGQSYDLETGLHYNYFRDYDPYTGRYIESDPIGLRGGINSYAYARSSPLSRIDPYGLASIEAATVEAIATGNVEALGALLEEANPAQADVINAALQRFGSTADQLISKECQAGVRRVFPKSVLNNTLKEILDLAKAGDREAKTAWKLLNDLRFKK